MLLQTKWQPGEGATVLGLMQAWLSDGASPKQQAFLSLARARLAEAPATEASLSSLAPDPQRAALELLLVLACLGSTLTDAHLKRLEVLNRQLARPTPWPGILRHAQAGRGKLATMALARQTPDGKALLRTVWRREGVLGVARAMLSSVGRGPANAKLASKYLALGSLPDDTLGSAFFEHMRSRGLPMPGAKGSLPEVAMHHDLMHVLTGFDTDARGEGRLAGFYAGMTSRHPVRGGDPFTFVMVGLMTFHLGFDVGPTFVGAERDVVDPLELVTFFELGHAVPVDVLQQWNFEEDLTRPLNEVRARFGLDARGALAMLAR